MPSEAKDWEQVTDFIDHNEFGVPAFVQLERVYNEWGRADHEESVSAQRLHRKCARQESQRPANRRISAVDPAPVRHRLTRATRLTPRSWLCELHPRMAEAARVRRRLDTHRRRASRLPMTATTRTG
jgi:hypothetical protein